MTTPDKPMPDNQSRDSEGRYQYNGNFDRLCVCGHRLGAHIHGGWECGQISMDYPETKGCECVKFRPSRKRADLVKESENGK